MCDHECHYADLQKRRKVMTLGHRRRNQGGFCLTVTPGVLSRLLGQEAEFVGFKTLQMSQKKQVSASAEGMCWVTLHRPAAVSSTC